MNPLPLAARHCAAALVLLAAGCARGPATPEAAEVRADLEAFRAAIVRYQAANRGRLPDSLEHLLEADGSGRAYLDERRSDPWHNDYVYSPPADERPYDVISYGQDGAPGGADLDQDLSLQMLRERRL